MSSFGQVRVVAQQQKRWPATAKMRALFKSGLTFDEIAEYVQRAENWPTKPTRSAVKYYYDRLGMPPRRPTSASAKRLLPWQIKTEHSTHLFRHMLDAEARKRERKSLSDSDRKLLSRLHELIFGRGTLLVFDYSASDGWCLRLREDDDDDIIRAPSNSSALRLDVRAALREAASDRTLADVAMREGVRPEVLENVGRDKAADILRSLIAPGEGRAPALAVASDDPDETREEPAVPGVRRRRAAAT